MFFSFILDPWSDYRLLPKRYPNYKLIHKATITTCLFWCSSERGTITRKMELNHESIRPHKSRLSSRQDEKKCRRLEQYRVLLAAFVPGTQQSFQQKEKESHRLQSIKRHEFVKKPLPLYDLLCFNCANTMKRYQDRGQNAHNERGEGQQSFSCYYVRFRVGFVD